MDDIKKQNLRLGAHCSAAGGLNQAIERIQDLQGTALQIFTRNQRQWYPKPLGQDEISAFRQAWQSWGDYPVLAHDSYLINLAAPEENLRRKSIQALVREIERCAQLGISTLVSHPGAHKKQGAQIGLRTYVQALDTVLHEAELSCPGSNQVMILLEITSGQGTSLGGSFQDLARIIEASSYPEKLKICFDTCHAFAAGYELQNRKGYEQTMLELDRVLGLERVQGIHLNDSKYDLGTRGDRHEHIGHGKLGLEPFKMLLNDPVLTKLPMVLETPKDEAGQWDRANLAILQELVQAA